MVSVLWHSEAPVSMELFTLSESSTGYALTGTVLTRLDGELAKIEYTIRCDSAWRTQHTDVIQLWRGEARRLRLDRDAFANWYAGDQTVKAVRGLTDIELAVTPSTNMLPLKRTPIAVGESLDTTGVWVQFPSLEIAPLFQTYTRLSETEYDYAAPSLKLTARLTFDVDGICATYGDLWKRV